MHELQSFYTIDRTSLHELTDCLFRLDKEGNLFLNGHRLNFPYAIDKFYMKERYSYFISQGNAYLLYKDSVTPLPCTEEIEQVCVYKETLYVISYKQELLVLHNMGCYALQDKCKAISVGYDYILNKAYITTEEGLLLLIDVEMESAYDKDRYVYRIKKVSLGTKVNTGNILVKKVTLSNDHTIFLSDQDLLYDMPLRKMPLLVTSSPIRKVINNRNFLTYDNKIYTIGHDKAEWYKVDFAIRNVVRGARDIILSEGGDIYKGVSRLNVPFKVKQIYGVENYDYTFQRIVLMDYDDNMFFLERYEKRDTPFIYSIEQ